MQSVSHHAVPPRPRRKAAPQPLLLLVCPTHRDVRELARIGASVEVVTHGYASDELEQMTAERPPPGRIVEDPLQVLDRLDAPLRPAACCAPSRTPW